MWVGKGQYLKRNSMHARGRSGVLHKYRSHLTVRIQVCSLGCVSIANLGALSCDFGMPAHVVIHALTPTSAWEPRRS